MNISTQIKKTVITLLVLLGVVSFGYGVFAQNTPGEITSFWEGEGLQTKHGRIVVMDMGNGYNPDIDDPSANAASNYTDLKLYVDNGISTIANLISNSKSYIIPSAVNEPVNVTLGSDTPDNAATLTVTNNVLGTAYTDLTVTEDRYLCADANGRIELCGDSPEDPTLTPINGQCAPFPETYSEQPADASNGCLDGTYNDLGDSATEFLWECQGIDGGTTDSCSATIDTTTPPTAQCAEFTETYASQPADASNGCVEGTYADVPDVTIDGNLTYLWECTGSDGSYDGCSAVSAPVVQCEDPVITLDDVTVTENASVESGPNGIFSLVFDDTVYENANINIALNGTSVSSSVPTDTSPMASGNYANNTWDISYTANCLSNGQEVTSNVIQVVGSSTSTSSSNTCAPGDKMWVDGTSFDWGGGYGYYDTSQNLIDPLSNPFDACGGYSVTSSDPVWYKYECIDNTPPNGPASGNYFKYTLNDNDLIYTDSSGVPINPPTNNNPTYTTIGSPQPWIPSENGYSRFVPVANAC